MAEQQFFNSQGLQTLLSELSFELPDQLPHHRDIDATNEALFNLLNPEARRVNPWYREDPANLVIPPAADSTELPTAPSQIEATSVLKAGKSAVLIASRVGYFDPNASNENIGYPHAWRFMESDRVLVSVPVPRFGDNASLAVCLGASAERETPEDEHAHYVVRAAWELRLPDLSELHAFGVRDEGVFTKKHEETIVGKYFPEGTNGIVTDTPLIRSNPGPGGADSPRLRLDGRSIGVITGNHFDIGDCSEVVGVGAAILMAAGRAPSTDRPQFTTVHAEVL